MNRRDLPIGKRTRHGWRWCRLCLAACLVGTAIVNADEEALQTPGKYSHAVLIRFEGAIGPMLQQYFFRKLEAAERAGADLLVVEIDSPGGFVEQSLAVAERLRDLDWARTVAYVPREALSGAAFVALGCDEIVIGPNAVLGDAGAIQLGQDAMFHYVPEKQRTDLVQRVRGLAEAKGRSPALAEAMVDMNLVVYQVKNTRTGQETFMSEKELESAERPQEWQKGQPVHESREKHFLEVNGARAVELGLAQGNASSHDELNARYRWEGELTILRHSGVDTAVYILNFRVVTGLLFVIGLVALYVEFSAPGIGMGILTAGLCFALFFWSRFLGGTAGWLEVVLFLAGLAFLGVELFVLPGFGVAGLSGALLLVASLILASQHFVIPETSRQLNTMTNTFLVLTLSGVAFVIVAVFLSRHFHSLPFLSRLTLKPPEPAPAVATGGTKTPGEEVAELTTGSAGIQVGDTGVADSALRPAGKARFGPRFVDVITDGEFINKGSRVEVVRTSGSRVVVSEVEDAGQRGKHE